MDLKSRTLAVSSLLIAVPAWAQPSTTPGGGMNWMVFGGGFLLGLAAGLLWCWLRCRTRKDNNDRDVK